MQTPGPAGEFQPDIDAARAVIAAALARPGQLSPAEARSVLDLPHPAGAGGRRRPAEAHPLVLGIDEDQVFGPVLFGQGGAATELAHMTASPPCRR